MLNTVKDFAFRKHDMPSDSQRYGTLPYSSHLEAVLGVVNEFIHYIAPEKQFIVRSCAVLHDTVEDTDTSPNDIAKLFGNEIADIVFRVSNERGFTRKERNFKTYPKIWVNDLAIFVKLADRIANTRNSKNTEHRMYNTYKDEYPTFKYALNERGLYPDMWKELDELYDI